MEFGCKTGGNETVLRTVSDLVCGDAYLIEGQSNALATDTREESPRETSEWIRSYGYPQDLKNGEPQNLWCNPVWKFELGESYGPSGRVHKAELGWWGMELAKQLVKSQQVPICKRESRLRCRIGKCAHAQVERGFSGEDDHLCPGEILESGETPDG